MGIVKTVGGYLKKGGSALYKNKGKVGVAAAAGIGISVLQNQPWYEKFSDEQQKAQGFEQNDPTHISYPMEMDTEDAPNQNIIHFIIMERTGFRNIHNIYLPQPGSFNISDSHSFGNIDENAFTKLGKGGLELAGDVADMIQNPGKLKQLGSSASLSSMAADLAVTNTLATGFIPFLGDFGDEFAFSQAAVSDDNLRKRFESSGVRTFSFDFKFSPRSRLETVNVANIISLFRRMSYPLKGINRLALNYPPEVIVNFKNTNENGELTHNEHYPALLPAFITGVDTDYSVDTIAHHRDGSPQSYTLKLQFTEVKRLIRDELETLEAVRLSKKGAELALFYSVNNEALDTVISAASQEEEGGE